MTSEHADREAAEIADDRSDSAAAIAAMYDRGDAISEAAVEKAMGKLQARGDPDPETRAAVETLADRLVGGLLGPTAAGLATAEDDETVETAIELFGSDSGETTDSGTSEQDGDSAAARAGD